MTDAVCAVRGALESHARLYELLEVVMDLGRHHSTRNTALE
jgi:hypothetical protein